MKFRVTLGHESVEVNAGDRSGAIKAARFALCDEWPRLHDVIMAKPDEAFKVEEL